MTIQRPTDSFQPAPTPPFEAQRLRDLYSLKILDTEAEQRFDRYTQLAADLFKVPIALVSLADEDRQWFKSAAGTELRETERSISLCGHVAANDEPIVVEDTWSDPRFANNPLVQGDPPIRFYAAVPLRGTTGQPVGTLCLIDHKPRHLPRRELALLQQLAALVESELQQQRNIGELRLEIERKAYFDPLTSLPNRRLLTDRLEYALQLAAERRQQLSVALLDLNNFSTFNSIYGRASGDEMLRAIASRLTQDFPPPCVIGRWSDDQFMLIEFQDDGSAGTLGQRILRSLAAPFSIGDRMLHIGAKIGVSSYPSDARDGHDLVQHAMAAMRANRPATDSSLTTYSPSLERNRVRRYDILRRLRQAISNQHLTLAFQPEMELRSGVLVGAEALLRWDDPELGVISATEATRIAEETSIIHALGEYVLRAACRQAAQWQEMSSAGLEVAVNLSAAQLHRADLVNLVIEILGETGLPGERLILEVTEGSLVEDVETAVERMHALKPLGVRFAIDDFGTGYSSFAYLAQLPVSRLKIDRSFVAAITDSADAAKVVSSLVELAHRLQLDVVAEGVETAAQLAFLQQIGCNILQGYYYSPPLSPEEFLRFAQRH
jgi:diguanylate cyclase (GGDEF)-like protein